MFHRYDNISLFVPLFKIPESLSGLLHMPDGAMIGSASTGKVTFIKLNEEVILIKIDEYPRGS
jgi:hypothetical protein